MTPNNSHWTDNDWSEFSTWLKSVLKQSPAKVTFTKKDGSNRVMQCTLDPTLLPQKTLTENTKPRKSNENTMSVYDLDAENWRSFIIKNVTSVELTLASKVDNK
jgi:hypothetical protein